MAESELRLIIKRYCKDYRPDCINDMAMLKSYNKSLKLLPGQQRLAFPGPSTSGFKRKPPVVVVEDTDSETEVEDAALVSDASIVDPADAQEFKPVFENAPGQLPGWKLQEDRPVSDSFELPDGKRPFPFHHPYKVLGTRRERVEQRDALEHHTPKRKAGAHLVWCTDEERMFLKGHGYIDFSRLPAGTTLDVMLNKPLTVTQKSTRTGYRMIKTDIRINLSTGWRLAVYNNSGNASLYQVMSGIIDSDYNGYLKINTVWHDPMLLRRWTLKAGNSLAQLVVQRAETCLTMRSRGLDVYSPSASRQGFGSSRRWDAANVKYARSDWCNECCVFYSGQLPIGESRCPYHCPDCKQDELLLGEDEDRCRRCQSQIGGEQDQTLDTMCQDALDPALAPEEGETAVSKVEDSKVEEANDDSVTMTMTTEELAYLVEIRNALQRGKHIRLCTSSKRHEKKKKSNSGEYKLENLVFSKVFLRKYIYLCNNY